jgi:hypothetical protein
MVISTIEGVNSRERIESPQDRVRALRLFGGIPLLP